jgi:hypothetical protein
MYEVPLNKFEKEQRVIALHSSEGKTIREISKEVHMSFRDISRIIKVYEKKVKLQETKKENNQQPTTKKLSLGSRAFSLFREGKKPIDVAIDLDIPFKTAKKFWAQFLNLERMSECYDLYTGFRYEIPNLLSIGTFMKRNNADGKDIANVLRTANDVINLNQTYSDVKNEIEKLKQIKNNLQYSQNKQYAPLKPLPKPINWNY